jgi:hypothetical protein
MGMSAYDSWKTRNPSRSRASTTLRKKPHKAAEQDFLASVRHADARWEMRCRRAEIDRPEKMDGLMRRRLDAGTLPPSPADHLPLAFGNHTGPIVLSLNRR